MGLIAALAPLLLFGAVIGSSFLVGNESCGSDGCGYQFASYTLRRAAGRQRRPESAGCCGIATSRARKSVDCAFAVRRHASPCLKLDPHSVRPESAERLSYSQVEEGTKIRARYIRALEDEDFGVLPGATYTKGFLRAYADYLGLDGHLFIDEFNSRYHDPRREDDRPIYPPSRAHAHRATAARPASS